MGLKACLWSNTNVKNTNLMKVKQPRIRIYETNYNLKHFHSGFHSEKKKEYSTKRTTNQGCSNLLCSFI